jgi:hypothetical protein
MNVKTQQVDDLFLVSYLLLKDFKPTSRTGDTRRAIFSFELSTELREEIENYYSHKTSVDALALFDRYRVAFTLAKNAKSEVY